MTTLEGMGHQADFIGYLHVSPPLNEREIELINRMSGSIFLDRETTGLRVAEELDAGPTDCPDLGRLGV
ncbi:hypothetical protein [Nocardioides sp. WS12]|uniref:hypothetical protein n=1 Tax=Nocardioides sp. WS12 TaxID=2486272 RepID=UPI0015FE5625|nr:hypothetical protein [Nocardioides sp. WS12]